MTNSGSAVGRQDQISDGSQTSDAGKASLQRERPLGSVGHLWFGVAMWCVPRTSGQHNVVVRVDDPGTENVASSWVAK